jgi:hypothetical protein
MLEHRMSTSQPASSIRLVEVLCGCRIVFWCFTVSSMLKCMQIHSNAAAAAAAAATRLW